MFFSRFSPYLTLFLICFTFIGCDNSSVSLDSRPELALEIKDLKETVQSQQLLIQNLKLEESAKQNEIEEDILEIKKKIDPRKWRIKSTDYTIAKDENISFALAYEVCLVRDPARCAKLVHYDGTIQNYLLDYYVSSQQGFMSKEFIKNELAFIRTQKFPHNSVLKISNPLKWYLGHAYHELTFYYAIVGEKTMVIHFDYAKGDGFLSADVETLLPKIFIP